MSMSKVNLYSALLYSKTSNALNTLVYCENKNVFSDCLQLSTKHSGPRISSSSEFQTIGPATEKARRPYELSR